MGRASEGWQEAPPRKGEEALTDSVHRRCDVLLVVGVLEVLLLYVGPESLDTLNERVVICERNY